MSPPETDRNVASQRIPDGQPVLRGMASHGPGGSS